MKGPRYLAWVAGLPVSADVDPQLPDSVLALALRAAQETTLAPCQTR